MVLFSFLGSIGVGIIYSVILELVNEGDCIFNVDCVESFFIEVIFVVFDN